MKTQRGFTLIELLVVVTIVAILAAIAVPSYTAYVVRGKIPDATSNLAAKRVQMEQYFQDNRTYVGAPACPYPPATPDTSTSRYFTFSCATAPTTVTYTLQAVGTGSMAGFIYSLDQNNNKVTVAAPPGWTTSATCWVTKKDGTC